MKAGFQDRLVTLYHHLVVYTDIARECQYWAVFPLGGCGQNLDAHSGGPGPHLQEFLSTAMNSLDFPSHTSPLLLVVSLIFAKSSQSQCPNLSSSQFGVSGLMNKTTLFTLCKPGDTLPLVLPHPLATSFTALNIPLVPRKKPKLCQKFCRTMMRTSVSEKT